MTKLFQFHNFLQAHLVVEIPPYHNQNITKPVNVQVFIEYMKRKCDPHSFTYDPIMTKQISVSPTVQNISSANEVSTNVTDTLTQQQEATIAATGDNC